MRKAPKVRLFNRAVGVCLTFAGLVATAAGLTVDLPDAWPIWMEFLGPIRTSLAAGIGAPRFYTISAVMMALGIALLIPWETAAQFARRFPYRLYVARTPTETSHSLPRQPSLARLHPPTPNVETLPQLANTESIQRLREVFELCRKMMDYAYEVHIAEVSHQLAPRQDTAGYAASLVDQYILTAYHNEKIYVFELFDQESMTVEGFSHLKSSVLGLFKRYLELVEWLIKLSPALHGEAFSSLDFYEGLYKRHWRALDELEKVQSRSDIREIAPEALLRNLKHVLAERPKKGEGTGGDVGPLTDTGLSWKIVDRGMSGDQATAVLRVDAVGPLPQPLELYVMCVARIRSVSGRLIPDPLKPTIEEPHAEMKVFSPAGEKTFEFKLIAPKLHPPSSLDILMHSEGNADIRVVWVKRRASLEGTDRDREEK